MPSEQRNQPLPPHLKGKKHQIDKCHVAPSPEDATLLDTLRRYIQPSQQAQTLERMLRKSGSQ
jgi:hypothetical protein